jgi:hypothetical protein
VENKEMTSKQIVNLVLWVLAIAFLGIVGYGSYKWYFKRPPTIVYQNTYQNTTVMPGANQTITNYEQKGVKQKLNAIGVGIISDKTVFVEYSRFF